MTNILKLIYFQIIFLYIAYHLYHGLYPNVNWGNLSWAAVVLFIILPNDKSNELHKY